MVLELGDYIFYGHFYFFDSDIQMKRFIHVLTKPKLFTCWYLNSSFNWPLKSMNVRFPRSHNTITCYLLILDCYSISHLAPCTILLHHILCASQYNTCVALNFRICFLNQIARVYTKFIIKIGLNLTANSLLKFDSFFEWQPSEWMNIVTCLFVSNGISHILHTFLLTNQQFRLPIVITYYIEDWQMRPYNTNI